MYCSCNCYGRLYFHIFVVVFFFSLLHPLIIIIIIIVVVVVIITIITCFLKTEKLLVKHTLKIDCGYM